MKTKNSKAWKKMSKKEKAEARRSSPFRSDSGVDHFHLDMRFYPENDPEQLDALTEALMADIRKACKKHGFLYSGTTQVVRNHA